MHEIFGRTELLLGDDLMKVIASKKVILFGVGGVGSWCAESLIRSGIQYLTIVDSDRIALSNINRQLPATTKTVGKIKVEVLKDRLMEINPSAQITTIQQVYSKETSYLFQLESYDYVIDAIDSLTNKMDLIMAASKTNAVLFASMGAALKMDSTRIKVTEFWNIKGCHLATALRRKFKRLKEVPAKKFNCVYSDELLENKKSSIKETDAVKHDEEGNVDLVEHEKRSKKAIVNGTIAHITAIYGFTLSGLVLNDIKDRYSA